MVTEYVKNWFTRADEDLHLIDVLLKEDNPIPSPICFHAQQAGEKYLKGFLAHNDLHVRKIHDLEVLIDDCKSIDKSFEDIREQAKSLNRFYTETRYPDDFVEFSLRDAKEGCEAAKIVKDFVLSKIKTP